MSFAADRLGLWRVNLGSRIAIRVLLRLARFEAPNEDALYRGVSEVDWTRWIEPGGTLWVDAHARDSCLTHTRFIAQRVKDAVVDDLRARADWRPSVEREGASLRLNLHLHRDRATLAVDSSGDSLHRRGWRRHQGRAPLSETLAAAVVQLSEWDRRAPLIDPFCGSGTLVIEAALAAARRPPGATRERFGFQHWPGHDARAFERLRNELLHAAGERPTGKRWPRILGSDRDPRRIEEARENAAGAQLAGAIDLDVRDALALELKPGWNAWIVSNLPYGERVGGRDRSARPTRQLRRSVAAQLRRLPRRAAGRGRTARTSPRVARYDPAPATERRARVSAGDRALGLRRASREPPCAAGPARRLVASRRARSGAPGRR